MLSLFTIHSLAAQKNPPAYQLTVISENDNYTLKKKDRYYTNGLMLRFATSWDRGNKKKIFSAEAGQLIFNPYKQNVSFEKTMDRPFTGFLYLKSGVTSIDKKGDVFKWNVQAAVIGDAAKGKEVQRWHHKNFGLPYPYGWETQLKSEFGVNLQAAYYKHLFSNEPRIFDAHLKGVATAGSIFSNVSSGMQFKLGAINKNNESAWWDARKQGLDKNSYELFLYAEPTVTYQFYNATVQGGLFTKRYDQYTTSIKRLIYSHSFGFMYAQNHWAIGVGFTYKTREAATMKANENYGSIQVGYRF